MLTENIAAYATPAVLLGGVALAGAGYLLYLLVRWARR